MPTTKKISNLPVITTVSDNDKIIVYDTSETISANKVKLTSVSDLFKDRSGGNIDTSSLVKNYHIPGGQNISGEVDLICNTPNETGLVISNGINPIVNNIWDGFGVNLILDVDDGDLNFHLAYINHADDIIISNNAYERGLQYWFSHINGDDYFGEFLIGSNGGIKGISYSNTGYSDGHTYNIGFGSENTFEIGVKLNNNDFQIINIDPTNGNITIPSDLTNKSGKGLSKNDFTDTYKGILDGFSGAGVSGYSGISGYSGYGVSGYSGTSGYSGSIALMQVGNEVPENTTFTLTAELNNNLIPVNGGATIIIPSGLPDSYSIVLLQNAPASFSIEAQNGLILRSPQGVESVGQYTTMSLLTLASDVFLVSIGNTSSGSQTQSPSSSVIASTDSPIIVIGAGTVGSGHQATYVQDGTSHTVTVTWPFHEFNANEHNGHSILLMRDTGLLGTKEADNKYYEICTNFTYIDYLTFSCTTQSSIDTTGSISLNYGSWYPPMIEFIIPGKKLGIKDELIIEILCSQNGSGDNKNLGIHYNLNSETNGWYTTSSASPNFVYSTGYSNNDANFIVYKIKNYYSTQKQILSHVAYTTGFYSAGSGKVRKYAIDTEQDTRISLGIELSNSHQDWAIIEYALAKIIKGE